MSAHGDSATLKNWCNSHFFQIIDDSQWTILRNHGEMLVIGWEGKAVDAVIWKIPWRNRVGFLVFGVYRFIDAQGRMIGFQSIIAAVHRDPRFFRDKSCVISFFIVYNQGSIHMRSQKKVLGTGKPLDFWYRSWIDDTLIPVTFAQARLVNPTTYIFIDPIIFLRERFKPHNVCRWSTHDDVKMTWAFGVGINVMTQYVCFAEQNFDDEFRLIELSAWVAPRKRHPDTFANGVLERSSHWIARLMLAKMNRASGFGSCNLLLKASWGITLEINDELLFIRLVFGFRRFKPSFPFAGLNIEVPSVESAGFSESSSATCGRIPLLPVSWEKLDSFSLSLMQ